MTKELQLYFTEGCHLCDDALSLLQLLSAPYKKIDIISSPELVNLYGNLIPVVVNHNGKSLNWPFDLDKLQQLITDKE